MRAFTCVLCLVVMSAHANNPAWEKFHKGVVQSGKDASPSQEIAKATNAHVKPYAAIVAATVWPVTTIPVCWENESTSVKQETDWVRDAVMRTWETSSKLTFTGWQRCAAVNKGIRILIEDSGPHVKSLGKLLDGRKNGMVLNFSFANWSQSCQSDREQCIRSIAVHEFGHAVGFTHEQNRPDAPGECRLLAQGTDPDTVLTPYDKQSVMNYCNKRWNNDGFLSALDVEAVQLLYGKP